MLLQQQFSGRAIDIAKLRSDDIRQFLATKLGANGSASHASHLAATLRSYFRYRATCGDQVGNLTSVISNPVHWKLASLPRALKPEEAERLLNSFTVDLRLPKRGYAIVRCALDMGLRSGEIAHLLIKDIDWRAGTVTLRGTKSLRRWGDIAKPSTPSAFSAIRTPMAALYATAANLGTSVLATSGIASCAAQKLDHASAGCNEYS